jgi:hypothetical protein
MLNHIDGVMRALAKKKIQWKKDLFSAVKLARPKHSKFCAEVTSTTGMPLISIEILDPFHQLRSCRKWDKGMDIDSVDETFYTTQTKRPF